MICFTKINFSQVFGFLIEKLGIKKVVFKLVVKRKEKQVERLASQIHSLPD